MKSYVLPCLLSAGMGALLAVGLTHEFPRSGVLAQERNSQTRTLASEDTSRPATARRPTNSGEATIVEYTPDEQVNIAVYEKANRGVVHITTRTSRPEGVFMVEVPAKGEGSGSVLDQDGHLLTNYHVIEDAREIRVTLFDGETYDATLVGQDPANDIAVLRIEAPRHALFPLEVGDSTHLRVGQKILAIGNPFGLERTLTVGIVSSLNRVIPSRTGRDMKSIIQIDAALNSGNSGGPLLNTRGQIVGMNTAIANPSQSGESTGVGFAIPAHTIRRVVPQLLEHGRVIRPVIGIASVFETDQGLVIIDVTPGGPADRAGLKGFKIVTQKERRGLFVYEKTIVDREHADLIVAVDGQTVKSGDEFQDLIESRQPGDRIVIRVVRDGREVDVPVTLGASD